MSRVHEKRGIPQSYLLLKGDRVSTKPEVLLLEETKRKAAELTESDRKRLEFDIYFEEMFAEAVALYLSGIINGDEDLIAYSRSQQGQRIKQDSQFISKLESLLHSAFFERLFSQGLRRVSSELPKMYNFARGMFEKDFRYGLS